MTTSTLETGLEAINRIALLCDRLVSVKLTDGQSIINLPTEAFDGLPMSSSIERLEQQWLEALNKLVAVPADESWQIHWRKNQVKLLQTNVTFFQSSIEKLYIERQWLQTAHMDGVYRSSLLDLNNRTLDSNQRFLTYAHSQLDQYSV